MIEQLMFIPEGRIVGITSLRDYVLIATEYHIYRVRHDAFTDETILFKVCENISIAER